MKQVEPSKGPVYIHADEVTSDDFTACAAISGEFPDAPLGIAFVIALRSLIGSGLLPDGAMMLGHRVTWHERPRPGGIVTEVSINDADTPRTRFQRVVIAYRTFDADEHSRVTIEQEQEVLWPVIA